MITTPGRLLLAERTPACHGGDESASSGRKGTDYARSVRELPLAGSPAMVRVSGEIDPDDFPPAVADVVFGDPCPYCGHNYRSWAVADDHGGLLVHRVAQYHAPLCPVLARGAYVVGVFPLEARDLAGQYLQLPDDE